MTITRDHAAAYLHAEFSELAASVDQANTNDLPTGYGPDIDNALRAMGEDEADLPAATVVAGDRAAFYALCAYYACRRFYRLLRARANTQGDGLTFTWTNVLNQAKEDMDRARQEAEAQGYDVEGQGWVFGRLTLDFVEPEPTAD